MTADKKITEAAYKNITDDEMFAQIAKNQNAMLKVIKSHEAEIKRLTFRLDRLEGSHARY